MKSSDITQEYVKERLSYDGQNLVWKTTIYKSKIGKRAGTSNAKGYRQIILNKVVFLEHRLILLYVHGYTPKEIDHINGIKSDNRIENLRECTSSINNRNSKMPCTNKSGVKGIFWDNSVNRWHGRIWADGKFVFSKCFESLTDATIAVREARELHHGIYAHHG